MSRYKAYPEYKDSGVEWLDRVPMGWDVMQLKRTVEGCVNGIWGEEPKSDGNDTIVIRVADFDRQRLSINEEGFTFRRIEEREKQNRRLKRGDLLLEKSGGGEKTLVGQVVLFDKDFDAVTSNFVAKMSPLEAFESRYLNYVFSRFYFENLNSCSIKQNTGIQNLDSAAYLSEKIGIPKKEEQQKIANFLDHETAKIDTLIAKQQELIKLLKEKRQAVISHAVTKGLNPNAPMRDSGVEWLGDVPQHWNLPKLKWISKTESGGTPNTSKFEEYYLDGDIPWVRTTDLNNSELFETPVKITKKAVQDSACSFLPVGSVLVAMYGGAGSIGKHALLKFESTINQAVCAILPNPVVIAEFLHMYVEFYRPFWMIGAEGTRKDPNINQDTIRELFLPLPPNSEQIAIVEFVQRRTILIDNVIQQSESNIELMQERRTALISAAVTGKIDVRDWQPPVSEAQAA